MWSPMNYQSGDYDDDDNDENIHLNEDDLPFFICTSKSFCLKQTHFCRGSANFN